MAHQILHILGTAQPEGSSIARMVGALARGLDPARYRIHAWFLEGEGPLVGALEQDGARASALVWWRGARDPAGAWKFFRRLRSQEFKIIQIHYGGRSVRWLARVATRAKIVLHLHSRILEPRGLEPIHFSSGGGDIVVAVSRAVGSRVVDGPVRVIYAGASDPREGSSTPPRRAASEVVLGTAGRLIELKGIEYLLKAAAVLQREFPALRVEIAGSGPQREKLEQMAATLGVAGRIEFLGWVDDLSSVLSRWDVFVLPSLEEGFPLAALEAMATGLPVVASSVGGVPELVVDGKTGWLVPPGDVEALAARLHLLLSNPEQRLSMGAAAAVRVRDHFSLAQMTENFSRLYDELLGETRT
ncbi:MAG: glycosyltransferase family 4 protein [Terriglobia bacterium]|jgi:glycosyltransferase involved in cell wall biosynthesis